MFILFTFILVIVSIIVLLIKWAEEQNKYWEKRKINFLKPKLLVGNVYDVILGRKNVSEIHEAAYNAFPLDEMVGFYDFALPRLIIRKPELIEKVMKNDFSHFTDRATPQTNVKNPLSMNLFTMCGNQWRAFRYKLSPIFTSSKLNYMFEPMTECGKNLITLLDSCIGKEVDMKEVMELLSMDVIGSCAFGMDPSVLRNPTSKFRTMGKQIFNFSAFRYFQFVIISFFPNLGNKLNFSFFKSEITKYYCELILNTLNFRTKHGIERNDFIQLLMQLQSKGKIEMKLNDPIDDYLNIDNKQLETYEFPLTDELLIGTAFGFLSAGFHTTASTLTYALYELSLQPEVLEKARTEIKDQVSIHGGITYDSLKCMTFLEKVLKETLRLHPAAPAIFRTCTKKYKFPNGLIVLPGDSIIIPVYAVQRDPAYYSDPLNFNPDRFDDIPLSGTYLPFGEGPRICIAMRFAIVEMKFALSKLLLNYDIRLSKNTEMPVKMSPRGFLNIPVNEVIFHITKR